MSTSRNKAKAPPVEPISVALLSGVRLFLLVAMGISVYLAWVSLVQGQAVGCGPESGCDRVLQSRWARWLGIPVSCLAVFLDALLLSWTLRLGKQASAETQRQAWAWLVPGALLLGGAALWFVALQLFVIRAICPYCLAAHVTGFAAALLLLAAAPLRELFRKQAESHPAGRSGFRLGLRGTIAAGAGLALLVLGQLGHRPKAYVVVPRPFPIHGQFTVDLQEVPVIGAPTNDQVMVSLFDYTCHHCRGMHPLLVDAQRAYSNRLVIASLPMPLDPGCNSTMTRPHPLHTNACEYARLALAVWRADRKKHHDYDDWLMVGEKPPPLDQARQRAIQLVGTNAFAKATQDPWVETQLKLNVSIYELAYRAGQGSMPQLIIGSNIAVGAFLKDELFKLLEKNLQLK